MKSNQLNSGDNPSASSSRDNPCFSTDPKIASLDVIVDEDISYLLSYAQFLYAKRAANPAQEKDPDAPPEKLLIHFAQADVVVLGSGLRRLEGEIQKCELKFVKSADRRFAPTLNTHIAAVTITLMEETP